MKAKIFLIAVLIGFFFSSCGHDSGNLIGSFRIVKKEKANSTGDYGYVTVVNSINDTLRVFVSLEEAYLGFKIGEVRLVGKDRNETLFLNSRVERGIVGDSKVIAKNIDKGVLKCEVLTRGEDTISVNILTEATYYKITKGDIVSVKKNRDKNKSHYFIK